MAQLWLALWRWHFTSPNSYDVQPSEGKPPYSHCIFIVLQTKLFPLSALLPARSLLQWVGSAAQEEARFNFTAAAISVPALAYIYITSSLPQASYEGIHLLNSALLGQNQSFCSAFSSSTASHVTNCIALTPGQILLQHNGGCFKWSFQGWITQVKEDNQHLTGSRKSACCKAFCFVWRVRQLQTPWTVFILAMDTVVLWRGRQWFNTVELYRLFLMMPVLPFCTCYLTLKWEFLMLWFMLK